ncbi:hypothetical protein AB0A63_01660 [Lentzea sp. NPDC042327]|uniref:hypothetical protein n=1 Tax=Lentzea sp. NPDC042327 TaxID=3154801 RepID=UPI0033CF9AE9
MQRDHRRTGPAGDPRHLGERGGQARAPVPRRDPLHRPLTATQQTLGNGSGPNLVVATAPAGSSSQAALALLAQLKAASSTPDRNARPGRVVSGSDPSTRR